MNDLLTELQAERDRIRAQINYQQAIAAAILAGRRDGRGAERALLDAGVPQLDADRIARHGWRDSRASWRRALKRVEKRIAGLERYLSRGAA